MLTRYSICKAYFHGLDWSKWTAGSPGQKVTLLCLGQEHIHAAAGTDPKPDDYRQRFYQTVTELLKAFALAVPHDKALEIRDDVDFFQMVRVAMTKDGGDEMKAREDRDFAIRRSFHAPLRRMRLWTFSLLPVSKNPTYLSCPISSSPTCAGCRRRTSR